MKKLILVRHAKSDWSRGLLDFDRPLNERGREEAPLIAIKMKEKGIVPDRIICSPANRALTTAGLMAEQYGIPFHAVETVPSFYEGTPQELAFAVEQTAQSVGTLLLVAHNPGISVLASLFAHREICMPTCCAVVLRMPRSWELSSAEEEGVYKPKDFK